MNESLNEIALRTGTDKSSAINDYCDFYEELFGHMRTEKIRILEIGVFKGNSIAMWEQGFDRADVMGIDYNLDQVERTPARAKLFEINAGNTVKLRQFAAEHGPWDIIIEDSAHTVEVSQAVIDALFIDSVKPGGFLVIEDTAAHWKRNPLGNPFTEWAFQFAMHATHLDGKMRTTKRDTWNGATPLQLQVDQVIFRPGIMAIKKVR